jgi:hypothetical protein
VTVVAGLVYFVILPLLSKINGINDQIQQENMKQENVQLHIKELPKVQKQYETLQENGDLSNVLLDSNKAVVLIEMLEKLADETNNKIVITVQDKVPDKTPAKKSATTTSTAKGKSGTPATIIDGLPSTDYLQIAVTLTGDYNSIFRFIDLLEKFEYYSDIIGIQISNDASSISSGQQTQNAGLFNVVIDPTASPIANNVSENQGGLLTASIDTVFYTK